MEPSKQNRPLNLETIAKSLGISKTTVSRAISGKGRIGEQTRKRVLDYIETHNYRPSAVARGLAQNKTYNLAVLISREFSDFDLPFVRKSLSSICETAARSDYDVVLSFYDTYQTAPLQRLLSHRKVDGVILTRPVSDDPFLPILRENNTPFVALGTMGDPLALQVDNDQKGGCRELTALLLRLGLRRIALLGDSMRYTVNENRLLGFHEAHKSEGVPIVNGLVYVDLETDLGRECAIESALERSPDCFICMDDSLTLFTLKQLAKRGISVPADVKAASLYDSPAVAEADVSALYMNAQELSRLACRLLLDSLEGLPVESRTDLPYQIVLRGSTK